MRAIVLVTCLEFTVTAHDGKVFVAQTGSPFEEIKAHRLTDEVVSFRAKRVRYEFVREGRSITRLVLKAQGMTLEAPKRAHQS